MTLSPPFINKIWYNHEMFGLNKITGWNKSKVSNLGNVADSIEEAMRKVTNGGFSHLSAPSHVARFAIAYRCVSLIAGSMARLPVYLEHVDGHIITDYNTLSVNDRRVATALLKGKRISGLYFLSDLIKQQATDLCLYGNTYLTKTASGGFEYHPPGGATALISRGFDGSLISTLKLATLGNQEYNLTAFSANDVVHARLPSLTPITDTNGLLGSSPLVAISDSIGTTDSLDKFVNEYFKRGGFGNQAIISIQEKIANDRAIELEDRLHRTNESGSTVRRAFTILGNQAKVTPLNTDTQTGPMVQLRERLLEDVARAYGVPGSLVGLKTTEVGTGLESLTKSFVRFALTHYKESLENAYSNSLFSQNVKFKFDTATFTAGDLASLAAFITSVGGDSQRPAIVSPKELRRIIDIPLDKELPVNEFMEITKANANAQSEEDSEEPTPTEP